MTRVGGTHKLAPPQTEQVVFAQQPQNALAIDFDATTVQFCGDWKIPEVRISSAMVFMDVLRQHLKERPTAERSPIKLGKAVGLSR